MKIPLVSIITINYNTPEITALLLSSLALLNYSNWEIIVVDNASPEYSSLYLKKEFPFIQHISSPVNIGFAGGNNIGIQFAKGEYIFLLNNDTEVTPNLITELVKYLQLNPCCAIACPKIKYHLSPQIIQYAGAIGLHPLTSRSYDIGYLQQDNGQFNDHRMTDLPNGAAMMIPALAIQKVGLMSELYFLYYEELDWAARFKQLGYEVHYVGSAEVFHKESMSTIKNSPFKTFYLYRNRLLYIRRNYQGIKFLTAVLFFLLIAVPAHIFRYSIKNEWAHAKAIWRALVWNMRINPFEEPTINSISLIKKLIPDGQ